MVTDFAATARSDRKLPIVLVISDRSGHHITQVASALNRDANR